MSKIETIRERFFYEIERGDLRDLSELIGNDDSFDLNMTNSNGESGLITAASRGYIEIVKYLIEKNVDLEKTDDKNERTALHLAARNGFDEIVKCLVEKGANIECIDKIGLTPFSFAAGNGKMRVLDYLYKNNANIECVNKTGSTPVILAAKYGHLEVIKYLCQRGANLECIDNLGMTPLNWAAKNGYLNIVKYLAQRGANLECTDNLGMTPLNWAAGKDYLAIVDDLYQRKASLERADNSGWAPIHLVAGNGRLNVVKYLAEKKVNLECGDNRGWTPLHWAADNGHLEIVKYLDEKNVKLECVDYEGYTPLHWAADNGHLSVFEYLVNRNVNINALNANGQSAFDLALENNRDKVVAFLEEKLKNIPISKINYTKSDMDYALSDNINNEMLCRFTDTRGIHVLKIPIKLKCGHAICLSCIIDSTGQRLITNESCCVDCINNKEINEIIENYIYQPYILALTCNLNRYSQSLLTTLKTQTEMIKTRLLFYESNFKFIEDDLDIHHESLLCKLRLIHKKVFKNIKKIKLTSKHILLLPKNERRYDDIAKFENIFLMKNYKINIKNPLTKDFGTFKYWPQVYIPKYRFVDGELKIQTNKYDLYNQLKNEVSNQYFLLNT